METLEARIARLEARVGPPAPAPADRALGLVRRGLPVRAGSRRLPGAPARPAVSAAAGRRLADLAVAGGPRRGQDAVRRRVGPPPGRDGAARRIALVGATAADVRDVMVEGPSGILAVCPPWDRPRYEPSKRRLTWPNGAVATTFTADEPDRLRGSAARLCLARRAGGVPLPGGLGQPAVRPPPGRRSPGSASRPRPSRSALVTELVADPTTAIARGTTYENRAHLAAVVLRADRAPSTRGPGWASRSCWRRSWRCRDGAWFQSFDPARHVTEAAEYDAGLPGAPGDRLRGVAPRGGGLVPGAPCGTAVPCLTGERAR